MQEKITKLFIFSYQAEPSWAEESLSFLDSPRKQQQPQDIYLGSHITLPERGLYNRSLYGGFLLFWERC